MVDMMYSKMYIEAKIQIRTCSENITGEWSLLWGNHIFAIHQRGGGEHPDLPNLAGWGPKFHQILIITNMK